MPVEWTKTPVISDVPDLAAIERAIDACISGREDAVGIKNSEIAHLNMLYVCTIPDDLLGQQRAVAPEEAGSQHEHERFLIVSHHRHLSSVGRKKCSSIID